MSNFWTVGVLVSLGMSIEAVLFVDALGPGRAVGSVLATGVFGILWGFTSLYEVRVKRKTTDQHVSASTEHRTTEGE